MVINKFSKTGTYHRDINRENQDYVYSIEGKDFLAIMLADGATACEKGLEGARLSCEAIARVIKQEEERLKAEQLKELISLAKERRKQRELQDFCKKYELKLLKADDLINEIF